jgi:hypothetical protein
LCPSFAGIAQTDIGIDSESQQFLFTGEKVLEPPVFTFRRRDQKKHPLAIGNFIRLCFGFGVANLRIGKSHPGYILYLRGIYMDIVPQIKPECQRTEADKAGRKERLISHYRGFGGF